MFNVTIKSWWHSGGSWFLEIRAGIQNRWEHSGRFVGREEQSSNCKISKARAAEFLLYCS